MVEQEIMLQPGESKTVSFTATPTEARTYQVAVNGKSGNFTAIKEPPGNFVYSNASLELLPWIEIEPYASPITAYPVFRCTITNQASVRGKRTVGVYYQFRTGSGEMKPSKLVRSFDLRLEPGESYEFNFDPRIGATPQQGDGGIIYYNPDNLVLMYHGTYSWYMFLKDDEGGESSHPGAA